MIFLSLLYVCICSNEGFFSLLIFSCLLKTSSLIPTEPQLMVNRNVMTTGCTTAGFNGFASYPVVSRMDPA